VLIIKINQVLTVGHICFAQQNNTIMIPWYKTQWFLKIAFVQRRLP